MSYSAILSAHMENTSRTLNVISLSYSVLQTQQQITQQLIALNRSTLNSSINTSSMENILNNETSVVQPNVVPITISLNELSFADMSSNILFQNIMNILENNGDQGRIGDLDLSSSTISTTFYEISNQNTLVCPISLEPFRNDDEVLQIRYCGHYFKSASLRQWLTRNTHCPICRYNLASSSSQ